MADDPHLSRRARFVWLAAFAAATFLAFPHPVAGGVLDLGLLSSLQASVAVGVY